MCEFSPLTPRDAFRLAIEKSMSTPFAKKEPMSQIPVPQKHTYGADYGPAAIRRLEAGYPITYRGEDAVLTKEYPDGRRSEIAVDADYTMREVRELTPASR